MRVRIGVAELAHGCRTWPKARTPHAIGGRRPSRCRRPVTLNHHQHQHQHSGRHESSSSSTTTPAATSTYSSSNQSSASNGASSNPSSPPLSSSSSLARSVARSRRTLRVAIVGSGPAGFYSARRLLQRLGADGVRIDMYERLPVPFGLVRFGVAPDHPEVKNCTDAFDEVAASPSFRFLGNVNVGTDVPLATLRRAYDALLFAYGAAADRRLGIPGEDALEGGGEDWKSGERRRGGGGDWKSGRGGGRSVCSARAFVGWYNGLPEYSGLQPVLDGDTAVILGQGNVALDVARVLLSSVDRLRETDIAEHALAALAGSRIRRVHIVGRRGPMQAAFTIKELRELLTLGRAGAAAMAGDSAGGTIPVGFIPLAPGLLPEDAKTLPRAKRRIAELLAKHSSPSSSTSSEFSYHPDTLQQTREDYGGSGTSSSSSNNNSSHGTTGRCWSLDFMKKPTAFLQDPARPGYLSAVELAQTRYTADTADVFAPDARVEPVAGHGGRSALVQIPASLAFRSIGYKSVALPGLEELAALDAGQGGARDGEGGGGGGGGGGVSFDNRRGIMPNIAGRVVSSTGKHIYGLYCAGWVKNGPTGVIATTMQDAFATAEAIVEDFGQASGSCVADLTEQSRGGWSEIRDQVKTEGPVVSWSDWKVIDRAERAAGRATGKQREKFASVGAMLEAAAGA